MAPTLVLSCPDSWLRESPRSDHYAVQRHVAARAEMGDLARWFDADGVVGEWPKLRGEAAAVHEYKGESRRTHPTPVV